MTMRPALCAAPLLIATALSSPALGATLTSDFSFGVNGVGLDGGSTPNFNAFTTADVGIATLRFGAKASGGDVDASANLSVKTQFDDAVALASASSVGVSFDVTGMSFEYDTFTGADAGAFVNFKTFSGINPPEFRVLGEDYSLSTSASGTQFNVYESDSASKRLAGVGPNASLGLGVRAEVQLRASQETGMRVNGVVADVVATHTSGATRTRALNMTYGKTLNLDLAIAGDWTLALSNLRLINSFSSSSGLRAGYELGLAFGEVGGGCGNYADDNDNENSLVPLRACVADIGNDGQSSQFTLFDPDSFQLNWGSHNRTLGQITVAAAPVAPVPLPASLPMLLAAFGAVAGLKRRRARKS